jgi:hypothetical protein
MFRLPASLLPVDEENVYLKLYATDVKCILHLMKTFLAFVGLCTCCIIAYIFYMHVAGNDRKAYKEEKRDAWKRIAELQFRLRMVEDDIDGFQTPFWSKSKRDKMKAEIADIKRRYNIN